MTPERCDSQEYDEGEDKSELSLIGKREFEKDDSGEMKSSFSSRCCSLSLDWSFRNIPLDRIKVSPVVGALNVVVKFESSRGWESALAPSVKEVGKEKQYDKEESTTEKCLADIGSSLSMKKLSSSTS